MRIQGKPELHDRLAAEYALGTLRGPARARLQRWMREDAALARAVADWEDRLSPLFAAIAPARPHARVWREVEERIGARGQSRGIWDNLAFWRGLGLTSSGMAAALLVAVNLLAPQPPQPAPAPVVVRVPGAETGAVYLAVLSDPRTQKPALLVSAGRRSEQLTVKTLDPSIRVADKSLQLWAVPASGAPRSLGLVGTEEKATLRLAAAADQSLADVPLLAVSLEPPGGSPTGAPTGPVLFTGACVKSW